MSEISPVTAIIVAAGTGSRMGAQAMPKQFLPVGGIPILAHTLKIFDRAASVDHFVLVIRAEDRAICESLVREYQIAKIAAMVDGGQERQDSVLRGLRAAPAQTEIVLIHDAVRMFVTEDMIAQSIRDARQRRVLARKMLPPSWSSKRMTAGIFGKSRRRRPSGAI